MILQKFLFFTAFLFLQHRALLAQITVSNSMTPQQLVQNVLLGQGVQASNITFSGDPLQIGYFSGNSSIGISNGILLASGDVNVAVGPNDQGGSTTFVNNNNTDNDLEAVANFEINDPSILEFDFIPTGDTVRFKYVFSSEEYLEFVGSFNDAFGFFISGPGINGPFSNNAENIALIPGTTTPVTINNVNDAVNSAYYVDNGDGATSPYDSDPFYVQFDGFTVILEAVRAVQCGETYHIKLAVGDALDNALESCVFLQAGSFFSNGVVVSIISATGDSTVVEGCADATFNFTRVDTTGDVTIHYEISGNAINGTDYSFIADSVTILQGQTTASLTVSPFADTLVEGTDTITIAVYNVTECGDTIVEQASLYILEDYTLDVSAADAVSNCPGDTVPLEAFANGGVAPYYFLWSNGDSSSATYVSPNSTDTFFVTVTDSCAISSTVDTVIVTMQVIPVLLSVSNDTVVYCPNDTVPLSAIASAGVGNGYQYMWNTGDNSSSITVYPANDTVFHVTATDACGTDSISDSIVISFSIPQLNLAVSNDTTSGCKGKAVVLTASGSSGTPPYSYNWSNGNSGSPVTVNPSSDSIFYVTVTDACGAAPVSDSIKVTMAIPPLNLTVSNDTIVDCPGDNASVNALVSSGTPPYSYLWSTGATASSITVSPMVNTTYFVTVTDPCGAVPVSDSIKVSIQTFPPVILTLSDDTTVNCPGDTVLLSSAVNGGAPPYSYLWSNNETTISIEVFPVAATEFFITVTDKCGRDTLDSVAVTVPVYPDLVPLAINASLPCPGDSEYVAVMVTGGTGNGYSFLWNNGSTSDSIYVSPGITTDFIVTVSDGCGTTATDTATLAVPVFNPILVTASEYDTICSGDTIMLKATATGGNGVYSFSWSGSGSIIGNSSSSPVSVPLSTGFYNVTATDQCGNNNDDETLVRLEDCKVVPPNIFTPDGDNMNQYFIIRNLEKHQNSSLAVFNRWGKKVYESPDYKNDWNGNGANEGVYFYILTLSNGEKYNGNVTITR